MDPTFFPARRYLGQALAQKGKYKQAIDEFEKAVAGSNGSPLMRAELAYTVGLAGKKDEARQVLEELKQIAAERYITAYYMALVSSGFGDRDETFNLLERAFQDRAFQMPFLKVDPRFDWLHNDPRFASLLERIGLQ